MIPLALGAHRHGPGAWRLLSGPSVDARLGRSVTAAASRRCPAHRTYREGIMESTPIFALQVAVSLIVYGLAARWYIAPRLATLMLPRRAAAPAPRPFAADGGGPPSSCRRSSVARSPPTSRSPARRAI